MSNAQPAVEHLMQQIEFASNTVRYYLHHARVRLDDYVMDDADAQKLAERAMYAYSCAEVIEAVTQ